MSRPLVQVYDIEGDCKVTSSVTMPAVFTAPIRHDVVHYVHSLMAKNNRQAYAVTRRAGMMVSYPQISRMLSPMLRNLPMSDSLTFYLR